MKQIKLFSAFILLFSLSCGKNDITKNDITKNYIDMPSNGELVLHKDESTENRGPIPTAPCGDPEKSCCTSEGHMIKAYPAPLFYATACASKTKPNTKPNESVSTSITMVITVDNITFGGVGSCWGDIDETCQLLRTPGSPSDYWSIPGIDWGCNHTITIKTWVVGWEFPNCTGNTTDGGKRCGINTTNFTWTPPPGSPPCF